MLHGRTSLEVYRLPSDLQFPVSRENPSFEKAWASSTFSPGCFVPVRCNGHLVSSTNSGRIRSYVGIRSIEKLALPLSEA